MVGPELEKKLSSVQSLVSLSHLLVLVICICYIVVKNKIPLEYLKIVFVLQPLEVGQHFCRVSFTKQMPSSMCFVTLSPLWLKSSPR